MYKALYLSPMIPSFDIKETVSFFQNLLGFSPLMNETNYVILHKDNLTIHILRAGTDIGQMEFYLEVDDVDAIWNSINNKLEGIKFKEPFNREYGMREIHIAVPKTNTLLFIGQEIKKP
jgi:catechol 2,3-dioxygenase-like lactoylglutathione lyase family enzyme